MRQLEEDADAILSFMASNSLVARQKKVLMILNQKKKKKDRNELITVRVGSCVLVMLCFSP